MPLKKGIEVKRIVVFPVFSQFTHKLSITIAKFKKIMGNLSKIENTLVYWRERIEHRLSLCVVGAFVIVHLKKML